MTFFLDSGVVCLETWVDLHLALPGIMFKLATLPGITFGLATPLGSPALLAVVLSLSSMLVKLVLAGPLIFFAPCRTPNISGRQVPDHIWLQCPGVYPLYDMA